MLLAPVLHSIWQYRFNRFALREVLSRFDGVTKLTNRVRQSLWSFISILLVSRGLISLVFIECLQCLGSSFFVYCIWRFVFDILFIEVLVSVTHLGIYEEITVFLFTVIFLSHILCHVNNMMKVYLKVRNFESNCHQDMLTYYLTYKYCNSYSYCNRYIYKNIFQTGTKISLTFRYADTYICKKISK